MSEQYKLQTSETVENLLKSYAKRRELLRQSHYFGMTFPAIKPRISTSNTEQTVDDVIKEPNDDFKLSTKIFPLPKKFLSTEKRFPIRKAQLKRFEKAIEPIKELNENQANITICKPTITNFTMIVTNIDELNNIDKNQSYLNIQTLIIYDVTFDSFIPYLITIAKECRYLQTLELHRCNVDSFGHLEEIAQLRNLHNVVVGSSANAITRFKYWYLYLMHRMSHLSLRSINGIKITPELCSQAAQKFGSSVQMLRLNRKEKQINDKNTFLHQIDVVSDDENQRVNCRLISAINQLENIAIDESAGKFVDQLMINSIEIYKRNKLFHRIWPRYFTRAVSETLENIEKGFEMDDFI